MAEKFQWEKANHGHELLRHSFDGVTVEFETDGKFLHFSDVNDPLKDYGYVRAGDTYNSHKLCKQLAEECINNIIEKQNVTIYDIQKELLENKLSLKRELGLMSQEQREFETFKPKNAAFSTAGFDDGYNYDNLKEVHKIGYIQGVCESVAALGKNFDMGKKLLEMAKKFAHPETFKELEQGIFAPQQELNRTQGIKR